MSRRGIGADLLAWVRAHPYAASGLALGAAVVGTGGGVVAAGGAPALRTALERITGGGGVDLSSVPTNYAADKIRYAEKMWSGTERALGDALRRMVPVAWPGVPAEAFIGFTTNGAKTANTAMAQPYGVENPFAEMGYFGTEGGPRSTPPNAGPYPNPTATANNSWLALHADPLVVRLLGHPATMAPDGWNADVDAQTAVGLVNLRKRLDAVNAAIPAGARAADPSSAWGVFLAFAGWSAGAGGTAAHVRRYAAQIGAAPESRRVNALVTAIAADIAAHRTTGWRARSHGSNPAYTTMRTLQKLEAGKALAARAGGAVAWFPTVASADQLAITRAAMGA